MSKFSKNFLYLIESLRSNTPVNEADLQDEDSRGKKVKRVERRRARLEGDAGKEFLSRDGDEFKLRPYLKVLEVLRDQIISERVSVLSASTSKAVGSKYAQPILSDLDSLVQKIASLIRDVKSIYDQENGKLEVNGEDASRAKSYTDQYLDLKTKYQEVAKSWKDAKDKELDERPVDQENEEIQKELDKAAQFFNDAKSKFINSTLSIVTSSTTGSTSTGDQNKEVKSTAEAPKLTTDLKKSKVVGKVDPAVKYIQESFIKIYNSNDKLKNTDVAKRANKYGADGKWGKTTSEMVVILKSMIKKLDAFKDKELGAKDQVNQNFMDGIVAVLKAFKLQESLSTYTEKEPVSSIKTFESFMKEKFYRTNEGEMDDLINAGIEAEKGLSSPEGSKEKVVVKKSDAVNALVKNKPDVKVDIKQEDVEKMMQKLKDEYKEDFKKELRKEDLVSDLKKIPGVQVVSDFDSGKSYKLNPKKPMYGYLAKCEGMRFFENGVCVITYGGELGYYDPETGYYKGKTGWREKISDLIKYKGVPLKYRTLTKKLFVAGQFPNLYLKDFTDMTKYPTSTVKTILKAAKWYGKEKNVDIFDLIRDAAKTYKEVKGFYEKNREAFKELA